MNGTLKLIPNLRNKSYHVLHHQNLRLYSKHGLKLTKINRGIKYEESNFLRDDINSNTESRKVATIID